MHIKLKNIVILKDRRVYIQKGFKIVGFKNVYKDGYEDRYIDKIINYEFTYSLEFQLDSKISPTQQYIINF